MLKWTYPIREVGGDSHNHPHIVGEMGIKFTFKNQSFMSYGPVERFRERIFRRINSIKPRTDKIVSRDILYTRVEGHVKKLELLCTRYADI